MNRQHSVILSAILMLLATASCNKNTTTIFPSSPTPVPCNGCPPGPPTTCTYGVSPTSFNFPDEGGQGSVSITTQAACAWSAVSNASWIRITSATSGNGDCTLTFIVDENNGPARTGTMTVAGITVTVTQQGEAPGPSPPTPSVPQCRNGVDDDGDGKVDFYPPSGRVADPGCSSPDDNDEWNAPPSSPAPTPPAPTPPPSTPAPGPTCPTSVDYTPAGGTIAVGQTRQLTVSSWPSSSSCQPFWYSRDPSRVQVNGGDTMVIINGQTYYGGIHGNIRGIWPGATEVCVQTSLVVPQVFRCYTWTVVP